MSISLKGDQKISNVPATKSKALRINLNSDIYGTFAEIGAGQETARNFFRAGGASGTIAKAMSAYDKAFSDDIYGIEEDHSPDGTQGVFNTYRAMENYVNEELIDIIQCDIKVKCVDISPTFSIDSNSDMSIIYSNMGGINETQFKYTVDEKFRHIPEDQYDDYFGEDVYEYELEYHDDKCVVYVIRDAIRLVEKRFGIRLGRIGSSAVDEETMKSYE